MSFREVIIPQLVPEIQTHNLSIISAPTGIGKSIELSRALALTGRRVFISNQTVAAVINLFSYQKVLNQERKEDIKVGYAAAGEKHYRPEDTLVYVTAGHLRHVLLDVIKQNAGKSGNWAGLFAHYLIIDEAHTGIMDNSLNVMLWNFIASGGRKGGRGTVPKLILLSASQISEVNMNLEPGLFASGALNELIYRRDVELPGKKVDIEYIKPTKNRYGQIAALIKLSHLKYEVADGSFLVFLPGKGEIRFVYEALDLDGEDVHIAIITGEMDPTELKNLLKGSSDGKRLIILGTNAIETSVTIPDLFLVIDSMQEKISENREGSLVLRKSLISKDSAKQRAGRVGRTKPGHVIRMIDKNNFVGLPESREAEIERLPLDEFVLELVDNRVNLDALIESLGSGIIVEKIRRAVVRLSDYHLIEYNSVEGYNITEMGRFVVKFPINIRIGILLWQLSRRGNGVDDIDIFQTIVIVSLLDGWINEIFVTPKAEMKESLGQYQEKLASALADIRRKLEMSAGFSFVDDLDLIIGIYRSYWQYAVIGSLDLNTPKRSEIIWNCEKEWTNAIGLKLYKLRRLFKHIDRISGIYKHLSQVASLPARVLDRNAIRTSVVPRLEKIFADRLLDKHGASYQKERSTGTITYRPEQMSLLTPQSERIIGVHTIESGVGGPRVQGTINFFVTLPEAES